MMKTLYESILDTDFDTDDVVVIPHIKDRIAQNIGRPDYKSCEHKIDIKVEKDTAIITFSTRSKGVDIAVIHSFWDEILNLLHAKYLTLKLKRKNGTLGLVDLIGDWENLTVEADKVYILSSSQHYSCPGKDATQVELKKSTIDTRELAIYQTKLKVKDCKLNWQKLATYNGGRIIEL